MEMNEPKRDKGATILNVVQSTVLTLSLGLVAWNLNTAVEQGKTISAHSTMLHSASVRLDLLEARQAQNYTIGGDIRVMSMRQDNIEKAVSRIETMLETHMKDKP